MTTNTLDNLDSALIRPGRVDLQVGFTLATNDQILDIYKRMYSQCDSVIGRQHVSEEATLPSNPQKQASINADGPEYSANRTSMDTMAQEFASKIPPDSLSPAEIQGYLLERKFDPGRALREIVGWQERRLSSKQNASRSQSY